MLNDRWAKRIMRATKTEVISGSPDKEIIEAKIYDRECEMRNCVQNHERIMNYLQKENASGHAHNLDMLLASLNINQHLREAFLSAEVSLFEGSDKESDYYLISFPFGIKTIEYKLSKRAVDSE